MKRKIMDKLAERVVRAEQLEAAHGAPQASQASQALHAARAAHEARAARAAWSEEQERCYEEGARKRMAAEMSRPALVGALEGDRRPEPMPATAEALRKYVQSKESQQLRFAQRKLFLDGDASDVGELAYTVHVTKGAERATISLLEKSCEIPLREIEVLGKKELGISAEEIVLAVCGMLGVSREEFATTLKLMGFGNNGENVLIKPNVVASGKTLKNNRPDRQKRKFPLVRCAMCDLCGRVNLATAYTVQVEDAPASWPCAKKLGLKVCGTKLCSGTADVLWVRGEFVRVCRDSNGHKATGTVMGGGEAPMPPT